MERPTNEQTTSVAECIALRTIAVAITAVSKMIFRASEEFMKAGIQNDALHKALAEADAHILDAEEIVKDAYRELCRGP